MKKFYFAAGTKYSCEVLDQVLVYIDGLHRLGNGWNYDEYLVAAQVYHGTRPVGQPVLSKSMQPSDSFYKRLIFDCWSVVDKIRVQVHYFIFFSLISDYCFVG